MLKFWGRVNSVNVKKALWAAEELGLKYERVDAGMQFGVTKTPEYRRMNPNSLVPTIDDDGFVLWESHSIVRYLAAKHAAGTLWPTDLRTRAAAERWMDWAFTFQGAMRDVFWGLVRTAPEKRDMDAIRTSQEKTTAAMKILDAQLGKTEYVAGPSFSYGDIPVGIMCHRFVQLVPQRPAMPNLDRWYAAISSRQAFKDHVGSVPLS